MAGPSSPSGGGGGGSGAPGASTIRSRAAARQAFTLTWFLPGHGNRREGVMKSVQRYDAAGGVNPFQASATAFALGTEERRDQDFFGPVGSFPTRVKILRAGTYRISYSVYSACSATSGTWRATVRKNGGSDLPGSAGIGRGNAGATPDGVASATFMHDFAAGDYFEVYTIKVGTGTGTFASVANYSMVTAELVSQSDETLLGGAQVAPRAGVLTRVAVSKGVSGWSGTTRVRMLKNAVSMMGSNDLPILASQNYVEFGTAYHSVVHVVPGDVLTLDVIGEESPYPRDLILTATFAAIG